MGRKHITPQWPFEFEYGTPKVRESIAKLFHLVKAKESRCGLKYVCVDENKMCVTDGRRLLLFEFPHEIETGLHFLTKEGFLLKVDDDTLKFPKYDEIISKTTREVCNLSSLNEGTAETMILFTLARAGVCINHNYIFPLTNTLDEVAYDFSVQVEDGSDDKQEIAEKKFPDPITGEEEITQVKRKPGDHPVKITAKLIGVENGSLTMVIIPVNIDEKYRN